MRYVFVAISSFLEILYLFGYEATFQSVSEIPEGYQIRKDTNLAVILETPLNSNTNQRGDQFVAKIKNPLFLKDKPVLPKNSEIRGLVKRVTKYGKLGGSRWHIAGV